MAGPLRSNRDFRRLWIGQAISTLGSRVTAVALPLLVLALTGSPARAGIVGFAQTLPFLVFFLPAGALVDRWDRKRMMLASDLIRAAALGSVALAIAVDSPTLIHLAAVAFIEGCFFVLFDLSEAAALPLIVTTEQLPTAMAQNQARLQGVDLAGQPLGGFLFGLGRALPFPFDTISYVISFVLVLFVRARLQEERDADYARLRDTVIDGLRWVWHRHFFRWLVILIGGVNFAFNGLTLVLIVRAKEFGASPAGVGILLAFMGIGALVGAAFAPRIQRSIPTRFVVMGSMWSWFVSFAAMVVMPSLVPLGIAVFVAGLAGVPFNVVVGSYTYALVPDSFQGRVRSVVRMIAWGTVPAGTLAAGFLIESLGTTGTFTVLAGVNLTVALVGTAVPAIRQAPSIDELLDAK